MNVVKEMEVVLKGNDERHSTRDPNWKLDI